MIAERKQYLLHLDDDFLAVGGDIVQISPIASNVFEIPQVTTHYNDTAFLIYSLTRV